MYNVKAMGETQGGQDGLGRPGMTRETVGMANYDSFPDGLYVNDHKRGKLVLLDFLNLSANSATKVPSDGTEKVEVILKAFHLIDSHFRVVVFSGHTLFLFRYLAYQNIDLSNLWPSLT